MNTPPHVDGLLKELSGPVSGRDASSGPSCRGADAPTQGFESVGARTPRPLNQRLTPTERRDLVLAYASGVKQKDLAAEYAISIRSVKRLVQRARRAG